MSIFLLSVTSIANMPYRFNKKTALTQLFFEPKSNQTQLKQGNHNRKYTGKFSSTNWSLFNKFNSPFS